MESQGSIGKEHARERAKSDGFTRAANSMVEHISPTYQLISWLQPMALGVPFNLYLQSQSPWSLFRVKRTW